MRKGLIIGLMLASITVLGTARTTYALHVVDGLTESILARSEQAEEQVQSAMDRKTQRQAELDAKRQAIEQAIADRRAAVTEKLTGERAERCEQKEATINQLLDNRVAAAERHLTKLKMIHEKLAAFVAEKELSVANANALELILSEKQDDAQASVDTAKTLDFECTTTDAHAPGAIVRSQITEAKQALDDYRTAIKDYAIAVRSAAAPTKESDATKTDSEATNEQSQETAQ